MRKPALLLVFLLLGAVATAPLARASTLPLPSAPALPLPFTVGEEGDEGEEESSEGEEAGESEAGEDDESSEPEPPSPAEEKCESIADDEARASCEENAEGEECVLEYAEAKVAANPDTNKVRLTVRYESFEPSTVTVETRLRGRKGSLRLGSERARFRKAGSFHDTFALTEKQMARALVAREFSVDLHAVGTPDSCGFELIASRAGGGHKRIWD
jgi:hypothetical protein